MEQLVGWYLNTTAEKAADGEQLFDDWATQPLAERIRFMVDAARAQMDLDFPREDRGQ